MVKGVFPKILRMRGEGIVTAPSTMSNVSSMVRVGWTEDLEDLAPGLELARRLDEVTVSDLSVYTHRRTTTALGNKRPSGS
ncbi:hypothetical protein BH18ACT5_BH18ACT5_14470 [soil metagenome]